MLTLFHKDRIWVLLHSFSIGLPHSLSISCPLAISSLLVSYRYICSVLLWANLALSSPPTCAEGEYKGTVGCTVGCCSGALHNNTLVITTFQNSIFKTCSRLTLVIITIKRISVQYIILKKVIGNNPLYNSAKEGGVPLMKVASPSVQPL